MDRTQFLATKGAHSVYLALIVNGPQTAAELVQFSQMDQRSVKRGLALLDDLGLLVEGKDGRWTLSAASIVPDDDTQDARTNDTRGARLSSSSSSSSLYSRSIQLGEKKKNGTHTARSHSEQGEVYRLLLAAGVGSRSPKMRELLDLALAPEFVERHVIYRQRQLDRGEDVPVGHLIQRLQSGDPVPVEYVSPADRMLEHLVSTGVVVR